MGFTYTEAYSLPVWQRVWFIKRTGKEIKRSKESGSPQTRAADYNTPDMRAMQGMTRTNAPSKLRRFT